MFAKGKHVENIQARLWFLWGGGVGVGRARNSLRSLADSEGLGFGMALPQPLGWGTVDVQCGLAAGHEIVGTVLAPHVRSHEFYPLSCIKLGMAVRGGTPKTQKMKMGGSEVQGPFWLHRGFEASLDI